MPDNKYTLEDILAEYGGKASSDKKTDSVPTGSVRNGSAPQYRPAAEARRSADMAASSAVQRPAADNRVQPIIPEAGKGNENSRADKAVRPVSGSTQSRPVQPKPVQPKAARPKAEQPIAAQKSAVPKSAVQPAAAVKSNAKTAPAPAKKTRDSGHLTNRSSFGERVSQRFFLFKQLVHRDFTGRYKRAFFGVLWSILSPMFMFAVQAVIFTQFFGRKTEHYISYLIVGNVVFHYFTDAANSGMFSLSANGGIISKINVPKWIFLLSKNVSCILNFGLTLIIMFVIAAIDGIQFHLSFFTLLYPIIWMSVFNIGLGMILSALHVFFRDIQYFWGIITQVIMYFSAIFYRIDIFSDTAKAMFYFNPVYTYITYFRSVIINNAVPDLRLHLLCAGYAVEMLLIGILVYKKNSSRFVYYF